MILIAHRGYTSDKIKENTKESIQHAINNGFNGIELDIQLCKTGEIVLHHDLYKGDEFIKDISYDILKKSNVLSLNDIYNTLKLDDIHIIIDIKDDDLSIVKKLLEFYENRNIDNIIFASVNRLILNEFIAKRNNKHINLGFITDNQYNAWEYDIMMKDISNIIVYWQCLNDTLIEFCNINDINVYSYTHTNEMDLKRTMNYNIYGIITDKYINI